MNLFLESWQQSIDFDTCNIMIKKSIKYQNCHVTFGNPSSNKIQMYKVKDKNIITIDIGYLNDLDT
jgi:hypothetical protein